MKRQSRDRQRLDLLVRAGDIFHQSLDVTETLNNVARLAVESFADICLFDLIDEQSERLFVTASAHRDPSKESALSSVASILYVEERGVHPVVRVSRTGEPFFLPHIDEDVIVAHAVSRQHEEYMRRFGYRSKIVVPVTAQDKIFGALTFVRTDAYNEFDPEDLQFAIELGRRAGLAVANAKQYHREQYVAETLQRSFLPNTFPQRDNVQFSAHYRPGSTDADIGGDWYDAFERRNGEIVITIGDITGKGIEAARIMVLMRQAIRVAALDKNEPEDILDTCNRLLLSEPRERLASAFMGVLSADGTKLRYASAGHPPPYVRLADGTLVELEAPSAPLGALEGVTYEQYSRDVDGGSMLVMYTDGIIEASRDAIEGERMLRNLLRPAAVRHAANPAEFIERAAAPHPIRDDIAIMVLSFGEIERRWQFQADDARAAYVMRSEFLATIESRCEVDEAQLATCALIFSEVVGNAVRYAPGKLSVSLELRPPGMVLHVIDAGPGFDYYPSLPEDIWSEGGRGMFLVTALGRETAVERLTGRGTHVSVTLPVTCR
ncbi:MAG TPA: SpoIIE family protein phosphatase [Candidatus Baltobacteraceae bacterium]|nr:SpoIIE family protein phosphatase [Candidatus Baltobacteraceae bacterium]